MRLKHGSGVRLVLTDGTALAGTVRPSWRWRTVKLTEVLTQTRNGEVQADGFLFVPSHAILFAQVGA
jgi:hypothetical protein